MRAVVMAGGEGTRLRPMTANQPKPLLPVVNRPIMEHVLRLLKRHGFDETVVTVQYLAAHIRAYFGDGDELGHGPVLRDRTHAARHRRQRPQRRRSPARRAVPGHLRRRAHRLRPVGDGRLPPPPRRAGHGGAQARAQPARVRHRHHRGGRPDRPLPRKTHVGAGVLGHRQHRDLHHGARGPRPRSSRARSSTGAPTSSRSCSPTGPRSTAGSPTATGKTSAPPSPTCGPRRTCSTGP